MMMVVVVARCHHSGLCAHVYVRCIYIVRIYSMSAGLHAGISTDEIINLRWNGISSDCSIASNWPDTSYRQIEPISGRCVLTTGSRTSAATREHPRTIRGSILVQSVYPSAQ